MEFLSASFSALKGLRGYHKFHQENPGKVFCRKSSNDNVHKIKRLKGSVAAFDAIARPRRIWQGIGKVTNTAVSDHWYGTRGRMLRVLVHQSKPKNDWFMSDSIVLEPHLDMKNSYFMASCCLILFFNQFLYLRWSLFFVCGTQTN